jgi:CheY-like chemotaxis protein
MSEAPGTPPGAVAPARRCLFGVTILLIEDSRAASEALRLFAAESGARLRRADSLASAHRHLAIYRPNVVVVDLGLPDGNGLELITDLGRASVPFEAIVAMSGNEAGTWEAAARDAGASACLEKPLASLAAFQNCILGLLPDRGAAAAPARPFRRRPRPRCARRWRPTSGGRSPSSRPPFRRATRRRSPTAPSSSARSATTARRSRLPRPRVRRAPRRRPRAVPR